MPHCVSQLALRVQHCTCPAGYEVYCPDASTIQGCIQLPVVLKASRAFGPVILVVSLVVISFMAFCTYRQWTADVRRLMCLANGSPLGELTSFDQTRQHNTSTYLVSVL